MVKLSLCIIAKAEDFEAFYLDRCLSYVWSVADEICVTITGKKGQAPKLEQVCKEYRAKVSYFDWVGDFAKARNFNFSQAKGDYIFWLDTDDVLKGAGNLPGIIKKMEEEMIDVGIMDYLYDFDEYKQCTVKHRKGRIVKNDGTIKWVGKLHEGFEEQRQINPYFIKDIKVLHFTDSKRINNAKKRNLEISLQSLKEDKDPRNYWNVANAYFGLGEYDKAITYYECFIQITGSEIERFTAYIRMASASMSLESESDAITNSFNAILLRPWFPDGYLSLGETYYKAGKLQHAKEFLIQGLTKEIPIDEYIAWNPRDYDFNPLRILADVYFELGKPRESVKCLKSCLKIYPKNLKIKGLITTIEKEIKKFDKIDKICKKAEGITDKKKLKKLLDNVPLNLKSHPKICFLRNIHFVKKKSTGKDLVIYCYPTSEEFDPDIVMKEGRGGSEEAIVHISKRLADLGWNVTVYNNCGHNPKKFGKVWWKPFWDFNLRDKQDVVIAWRLPMLFDYKEVNATKKYVWLHDVLKPKEFTPRRLENLTKVFALSKYQRDLFPNVPDNKFMVTGNGICPKHFDKKIKRNPFRMIYTSSYDRGLECLLKLFPIIKKVVPKAELHIFYGWHVWDSMHKENPSKQKEKEEMIELMNQEGVYEYGRVSQEQIIEEYQKSNILAYPSEFPEISYITGMKAQAAGCIPVTTTKAALNETIQFGLKINSQNIYSDKQAQEEWINGVINLLKNPPTEEERQEMMSWAKKKFDWDDIASCWDKEFKT